MSSNSFGRVFKFTTWGESHGQAIGCVVDGVPPKIPLSEEEIQSYLDKRKPGSSVFTTQRKESDQIKILSGVFEGLTTGTPISMVIFNEDTRSKDYDDIRNKFRPGHADYTYMQKYGIRDHRGGGRSSARETAMRVAAGVIARKILGNNVTIRGCMVQMGSLKINRANWDWNEVANNPFFCPDKEIVPLWEDYLKTIRKNGSSIGAVIELHADGVVAGLGAPIYGKLDADIASAMMGINAVKAVEIGDGMEVATLTGEENSDEMTIDNNGEVKFLSNHAGGILGGISTGQTINVRFAVKPTSSILIERKTINTQLKPDTIITKGRHDPCVGIRAVPVGEAMLAITLADHLLLHRAQCGK